MEFAVWERRLCPQFLQKLIPFFLSVRLLMGCTTVNQAWLSVTVHPAFCWEGNNLCRLCDISEKYFPQPSLYSYDIYPGIKAVVHPKILILSSFTHSHVVPNLYYFHFVWHTWCILLIYLKNVLVIFSCSYSKMDLESIKKCKSTPCALYYFIFWVRVTALCEE